MTALRSKTGLPAVDQGERNAPRENSAQDQSAPGAAPDASAFSEFLSRGAEEIQDHLSLVARIQVHIGRLLETSVEELERAQRLETLTSLISGSDAEKDLSGGESNSFSRGREERPAAYLEHEIKTLRKMQKLLGVRVMAEGEDVPPAIDVSRTPAPHEEGPESTAPRKILMVFHDPGMARILRYFLEKEDFDVLVSSNGQDGLQKAIGERPDLILLGILLPGLDGYQVLARLKKNVRTAEIPVFVLSVLAQEVDILKAIEGGAADYFVKPFSPPVIIAKIRRALRVRHE